MTGSKLKYLMLGVSTAAFVTMYSTAYAATTISIGVAPSFANTLNDVIGAFQNYYIVNGNLSYNVVVTIDTGANLESNVVNGGAAAPYDLLLSSDALAPVKLYADYNSLVVGSPFPYAKDSLDLYSASVDISAGLPTSLNQPFVLADPRADVYGTSAAEVLLTTPGVITAYKQGYIQTRPDIGTTFAAADGGTFAYGFVAKSQICQYYGGSEQYVPGTYHHEYVYNNWAHPYVPIVLTGIKIARTRAADQETELTNFVNFLTGVGSSDGTSVIKQYCFKTP
jgi:molybdate transport system substrate-binding protein